MLRAIAVALTLFALYWLTVSGAFHSIDEEAVFAVARNIVLYGEANQNTLYRAVPYIDQAKVGIDGAFYSKYGIGHALAIAPAVWLAQGIPSATLASSAMLVNALATAATGGLLVLVTVRLGYSERTGVLLGLMYGTSTIGRLLVVAGGLCVVVQHELAAGVALRGLSCDCAFHSPRLHSCNTLFCAPSSATGVEAASTSHYCLGITDCYRRDRVAGL
jgi:hypothetical protein